ncbi:hypothetical protein [Okeania sp. SIO2B3]|nr:hypothetical protein [Okeania sp. SIO2B3]NET44606.1 hypothetical protein [Okeania sp. SIO2B3]
MRKEEGRRKKAENRKQKTENRKQKAEGKIAYQLKPQTILSAPIDRKIG